LKSVFIRLLVLACVATLSSVCTFGQTVTVSPTSLSFGNQVLGTSSSVKKVTLKNGQSTSISVSSIVSNLADFTRSTSCSATLTPGSSCTISVTFTPSALGLRSGTLSVNDTGAGSPQTVALSGTGVAAVTATPSSISFGNQPVGQKSAASLVTVTNNQSKNLSIASISTNLADYTATSSCPLRPKTLAARSSCTVSVFFTPAITGTRTATLTIADNASVSPTVSLSGTGAATLVSIAVTPANPSFALGTTQQLQATGTYSDGSTQNLTSAVSWNTANHSIATVNAQGLSTSVAVGSTTATAISGSVTGSTTLNVTSAALVSIAVTPAIPSIPLGTTQQFTATGTFTNGTMQNITNTVQWSSDTTTVATISNAANSQGLASAVGTGSAKITATSGSIAGSTTLTVTAAALVSIAVTPANPSISLGTTQQFTATGSFTDGSTQDLTSTAAWASDTASTATINKAGLATSTGTGTAIISATSGSVTGSTVLTVTAASLVSIAITPQSASVPKGQTQQFTATGTYTDGTTQDLTQTGRWSSSAAAVATISNSSGTNGLATTLATGTTTIGISSGSVTASSTLTVTPAALVSIAISPQSPTIPLGTSQQFTASGTYTDSSTQDVTSLVTWSSSSAQVAIISNNSGTNGLATSAGVGTANITATSGSVTASTSLAVGQAVIVSIAVSPATVSAPLGSSQQFAATATYTDGSSQDITQSATWASSVPAVATINSFGLAASLSIGSTNISAGSGSVSGSTTLTVTAAVPVSLAITPQNPTAYVGSPQPFTATLTYTDGTSQDVTSSVAWSSSNLSVATISTSGQASPLASGTTMIQANWGANSLSTSTTLSVISPTVAVTPTSASLSLAGIQQFSATVIGSSNQNVTWSLSGLGSLTSTGLYTAPSVCNSSPMSATVTATSVASPSSTGTAIVTISASNCAPPSAIEGNTYCNAGNVPQFGSNDGPAALPQTCYYTALEATPSLGTVRRVTDVASWNSAWAAAVCGDIIQIPAGTAITAIASAGLSIPTKTCDANHYITVETSAVANLPAEGNRLTPCYAGIQSLPGRPSYPCPDAVNYMAKIVAAATSGGGTRAITISANSAYIRFIGLEITRSSGSGINSQLVNMNAGGINHIIFDRVWGHGNTTDETTRFASMNRTSYFALIDSSLTDFWCVSVIGACTDAQAISGGSNSNVADADNTWKAVNNFLEGAAETIELGGGSAALTPTGIEIRLNHMFKPLTWNPGDPSYNGGVGGHAFIVKNLWETKNSDRVLLEANVLENVWAGFSQQGDAVTLTPKNQSGGAGINLCPSCQVTNTTIRYNKIRTSMQPFQIANIGNDNGAFAAAGNSYSIHDNVADNQGYATCYRCATSTSTIELIEALSIPASLILHDVSLDHNTIVYASGGINPAAVLGLSGAQGSSGLEMFNIGFTNNLTITRAGTQNSIGSGITTNCAYGTAAGAATVDACWNPQTFGGNAFIADGTIPWPGTNCTAETSYPAIFVDYAAGDYHVKPTSACSLTGTDGRDPGANIDLLNAMIQGVQ
jgi:hypothetical protein